MPPAQLGHATTIALQHFRYIRLSTESAAPNPWGPNSLLALQSFVTRGAAVRSRVRFAPRERGEGVTMCPKQFGEHPDIAEVVRLLLFHNVQFLELLDKIQHMVPFCRAAKMHDLPAETTNPAWKWTQNGW